MHQVGRDISAFQRLRQPVRVEYVDAHCFSTVGDPTGEALGVA